MHPFHRLIVGGIGAVEILGQLPGKEAQAAYSESQIMLAKKLRGLPGRPAALLSDIVETQPADLGPQGIAQPRMVMRIGIGLGPPYGIRNILDDRRQPEMPVGAIGKAGELCRLVARLASPGGNPRRSRPVEEKSPPEQAFDMLFDLAAQILGDQPHLGDPVRAPGDRIETVADRLFAGDVRDGAKDRREEAGQRLVLGFLRRLQALQRLVALCDVEIGAWIDIDKAPVDLPLGRPVLQRLNRLGKGCIGEDRAVDQHRILGRSGTELGRQYAFEKGGAPFPYIVAVGQQLVQLPYGKGREGPGEAGRGAAGKGQGCRIGDGIIPFAPRREANGDPVLHLECFRRTVQLQLFGMADEIGYRHEQVERLARRQQSGPAFGFPDCRERVPDQAAEYLAAKWRCEPASADKAGELHLDLFARFLRNRLFDRAALAAERHPRDRFGPEFGKARQRPGIGIKQLVDIGGVEPQVGQRIQRLARENGLRQKYAVDPPGTGPGDDVRQHAKSGTGFCLQPFQYIIIDSAAALVDARAVMKVPARLRQFPDFLGDPVHVDRQTDTAVADQGQSEFFLPHAAKLQDGRKGASGNAPQRHARCNQSSSSMNMDVSIDWLVTPAFAYIWLSCDRTVPVAVFRKSAISLTEQPLIANRATSDSPVDNCHSAKRSSRTSASAPLATASAPSRRCASAISLRVCLAPISTPATSATATRHSRMTEKPIPAPICRMISSILSTRKKMAATACSATIANATISSRLGPTGLAV